MERKQLGGHFSALVTVLIWGTTFISTKVLLADFAPVEILFLRFVMGFAALYLAAPRKMEKASRRQELTFATAGLCGVCLYYLMENIALTYTMASNVGVIVSVSPFFTAILSRIILKEEKLHARFFLGFVVAMAGIALISFNGAAMKLNLTGDFLALMAALMWGCYSTFTRKISGYGFSTILTTRRTFFYGILFMIPALCLSGFRMDTERFFHPVSIGNLLFLGLGASALCFVTWNYSVKVLGAIKTSIYIYMIPVVTVLTSALVLKEPVTWMTGAGTLLTLAGLFLSEGKKKEMGNTEKREGGEEWQ